MSAGASDTAIRIDEEGRGAVRSTSGQGSGATGVELHPPFKSLFLGGFECSSHKRNDGRRLDLLASTGHDRSFDADYRALMRHGILAARDGFRWHMIETTPGRYDWTSALGMIRAARDLGLQVIWDLCHYGWPDDLDIWSDAFVTRFARFAAAAAQLVCEETDQAPFFCTVNETSFWAWAGGEVGYFAPASRHRGNDLKQQLVRASVAATTAVRRVAPAARFIHAEPGIHVVPGSRGVEAVEAAERYRLAQFEALDMVEGSLAPAVGGAPEFLDIVGINFYPNNQWYHGGSTIPLGHHEYRPLRDILAEFHRRYRRPLMLSETGAEGTARAAWLYYVSAEVRAAQAAGVPVQGICLYPILDYPGWDNDRPCTAGLFSMPDETNRRTVDLDFAQELRAQRSAFSGRPSPPDTLRRLGRGRSRAKRLINSEHRRF